MKKVVKKLVLLYLILVCFGIGFVSCGKSEEEIIKDEQDTPLKETDSEEADYSMFLKKIWITELDLPYNSSDPVLCAFYITDIKDGNIKGKIKTIESIEKEYYYQGLTEEMISFPFNGDFSGTVQGDMATCEFKDHRGYSGNISLIFQKADEILVIIDTDRLQDPLQESGDYSETNLFTPWTLESINGLVQDSLKSETVKLDDFGKVQIVRGNIEQAEKMYPCVYLTDEEGNILYSFEMGYAIGMEVSNLSIEDLNGDGYADISIELEEKISGSANTLQWDFYRQSEGVFEKEGIEDDGLNAEQELDYNKYKEKIWCLEYDFEIEGNVFKRYQFSFYFSQFCNGKVYGRCRLGDLVRKDWYDEASRVSYQYGNTSVDGYFFGEFVNGVLVCRFWDQSGNEGWLKVQNWEENSLEVELEWTRKNPHDGIEFSGKDGTYSFRTWNLEKMYDKKEENGMEIVDKSFYSVDMQYWGNVQLVTVSARHVENNYYCAYAYLTTSDGDILYEFDLGGACESDNSVMVTNVEIEDYNEDDLEDIIITVIPSYEKTDSEGQNIQTSEKVYFYQQENGRFSRVICK
ncbi:MAG: hypothetical protein J6K58_02100 [Lachnospiraceae bacterium]|nr:hypothetical protein [Lachnospiraceae bacterium]